MSDKQRSCQTCKHRDLPLMVEPCDTCTRLGSPAHGKWEPREEMPAAPPTRGEAQHVLWTDADADRPKVICDANGQVVLDLCKVCGRGEAELIEHPVCTPCKVFMAARDERGFDEVAVTASAQASVERRPKSAADILDEMAATFRERNRVYGSNYKMVAPIVAILFPNGVPPELVVQDEWHLMELLIVKLSRFAISNFTHQDSIRDLGVYAAMVETIITEKEAQK